MKTILYVRHKRGGDDPTTRRDMEMANNFIDAIVKKREFSIENAIARGAVPH